MAPAIFPVLNSAKRIRLEPTDLKFSRARKITRAMENVAQDHSEACAGQRRRRCVGKVWVKGINGLWHRREIDKNLR
jgi:hypothetical protein